MNIVVFGGGNVGKFGSDFCIRARTEGHNVIIFSHKDNGTNDNKQYVINYYDMEETEKVVKQVIDKLDTIDLVLFNQSGSPYPSGEAFEMYPDYKEYQYTLNTHVIIIHLFLFLSRNKLAKTCKVINMTSNMMVDLFTKTPFPPPVGYGAGKAWATHTVQAYATNRKNHVIYFTITPSMNYNSKLGKESYLSWFSNIYKFIINSTDEYNGKIFTAYQNEDHHKSVQVKLGVVD